MRKPVVSEQLVAGGREVLYRCAGCKQFVVLYICATVICSRCERVMRVVEIDERTVAL